MGKASRWFRAILGLKKPTDQSHHHSPQTATRSKDKKRWSFVKSHRDKDDQDKSAAPAHHHHEEDPNKHAIAVAAATAAVAEAAVAAAHAAAEVVRLTSSSGRCFTNNNDDSKSAAYAGGTKSRHCWRQDSAAIKIQSAFRGYLARRALRALKALVRLQALVRGRIERKRTAEWLHRMQSLIKAQARAQASRLHVSESSNSSCKYSHIHHPGPQTPENFEHAILAGIGKYEQRAMIKRIGSKSGGRAIGDEERGHLSFSRSGRQIGEKSWQKYLSLPTSGSMDDEKSDKILEIDTGKPNFTPKSRNIFHSFQAVASDQYSHGLTSSKDSKTHVQCPSSGEVQSPLKFLREDEESFCTAENSPQFNSASSRGGSGRRSPFTPSKSDGSTSFISAYSDYYPKYMSYTESSRAKMRSLSAPKQRPQYERSSSTKKYLIQGFGESRSSSAQRASALRANCSSKAYAGSGHLERLGVAIGQRY